MSKTDVIIVGAGIVGLANALAAAKRGRSVQVLERSSYAQGASIRNFGMVWPIGQPVGERLDAAMLSRDIWLEVAEAAGFWTNPQGSICLAIREDELAVMSEFVKGPGAEAYQCELLGQEQAFKACPAANREHVIGGLLSQTEVGVDPREAIAKIPKMLAERYGVTFRFDTPVVHCQPGMVRVAGGRVFEAKEQIVVCSGADIKTLYPAYFDNLDVRPCKLQMLATGPQPGGWNAGPMVSSGPSMRHYEAFHCCPSLEAMSRRNDRDNPEWGRLGIHFMAAQNGLGEVVLGDSHEYGQDISPFNSEAIDQILIDELQKLIQLPDFRIARRWQGVYLKSFGEWCVIGEAEPGVTVFNGMGGMGMTMSFGLADRFWSIRPRVSEGLKPVVIPMKPFQALSKPH